MSEAPQLGGMFDVSDILQNLGNKGWTGTAEIIKGDQQKQVFLFFRNGVIQHAKPIGERVVLGLVLYKLRKIDLADLNFVLTAQQRLGKNFGETCLHYDLVTAADIREGLLFRGREEVLNLFLEPGRTDVRFTPGDTPKADVFESEDLEVSLGLNPMGLLMEAARREDEWKMVQEHVESLDEVFARTESGKPVSVELRPLLLLCDGCHTVAEIARFSPYNEFDSYGMIRDLYRDGFLQTVTPMELARAAVLAEQTNNAEKALRLFELAEARGLGRIEVSKRIALAHQQLGHKAMAFKRWMFYADKCVEQSNPAAAVEGYRAAIEVDSSQVLAYQKCARVLEEQGQTAEAAAELHRLIDFLSQQDDQAQLVEAFKSYIELAPEDTAILSRLAEAHAAAGAKLDAIECFEQIAQVHRQQGQVDAAITVYRRMLEVDQECLHGRLALAQTLGAVGRAKESVQEYQKLAGILERSGIGEESVNWTFLIKVYESMVELDDGLTDAWKWLGRTYEKEQKIDLAVSRYMGLVQALVKLGGREAEMVEPMTRVAELAPERTDVRKQLAQLHARLEDPSRAVRTWFSLASYAISLQDKNLARESYRAVLEIDPMNLEARAGQARIDESNGKLDVAARRWRIVGGMAVRAGLFDRAERSLRRSLELDGSFPEIYSELADACEGLMKHAEAADFLLRYADAMLRVENYGLARGAIEKARGLAPNHPQLGALAQRAGAAKG